MNHLSEDKLIEFADGLLNSLQEKEAEEHLALCASCREELEMYRSLTILMQKENIVQAPPATANLVMQQVELHHAIMVRKAKSRRTAIRFLAIMTGLFALIAGLGIILMPESGPAFHMPDFVKNAIDYMVGKEVTIKNPVFMYIAVSAFLLLATERIFRSLKPRKVFDESQLS
jgi:hypothetical protein